MPVYGGGDGGADPAKEAGGIGDTTTLDDKTLEMVVIMCLARWMMRRAARQIALGRGGETEQQRRRHRAMRRLDQLDRRAKAGRQRRPRRRAWHRLEQAALGENDEIGAGELSGKDLLPWSVMVERGVGRPLRCERRPVVGQAAGSHRGGIADDD